MSKTTSSPVSSSALNFAQALVSSVPDLDGVLCAPLGVPCAAERRSFFLPGGLERRRSGVPRIAQNDNGNITQLSHLDPLRKKARCNGPSASTLFLKTLAAVPQTYGRNLSACANTLSETDKSLTK